MKRAAWQQRYAEVGTWRREYGPNSVPVKVVAASPEMREICNLIEKIRDGEAHTVLVQAPSGGGKSTVVSAAIAEFAENAIEYRLLAPGDDYGPTMLELARNSVNATIIIDNCDVLDPTLLRKILEKRRNCNGLLLTAAKVPKTLTTLLSEAMDHYVVLPRLEERPEDLLLIASILWEDLASGDLAVLCDDSAVEVLLGGPHATGAWSLQRVLLAIVELRASADDILDDQVDERISFGDITPVLLQMYKESLPSSTIGPADAVLVVEGDTDERYLLHAAKLAADHLGWDLLDGLSVQAAAPGRSGGATEVGRRLLQLSNEGTSALGLFDYDPPGSGAHDSAKHNKLQVMRIPAEFDALSRDNESAVVEAEDLLPSELLRRYYERHEDQSPEEWHWRLDYLRIVPHGAQKGDIADWVCSVSCYEDMERFVYLLVDARKRLRLPCPSLEKGWLQRIRVRPVANEVDVIRRTPS
ncbi:MAG TPA: hypothetical protein VL551_28975 [Actinospica sp.]|jgi:hypothetical protein|nr:hypothetical protein [Actinospica sp.]